MAENEPKGIDEKLRRIEQLVSERQREDYESLRARLIEARDLFHDLLAERFTEPFNAHLAAQPSATLQEKQALARAANTDLRSLSLAIRCPKTAQPAILLADPGYRSSAGRFQITLIADATSRARTSSSVALPHADLMPRPPEQWRKRVAKRHDEGHGR